jgi:serine/threonine-protein kinase
VGARPGLVITESTEPIVVPHSEERRHRRLWWVAGVIALLAVAVVGAQVLIRPSHVVPDLAGMSEGEARNAVVPFDWEVVVRAERSDTVPAGAVIATDPVAGRSLREGSTLVLVIAEGETLATLPDVSGLPTEEAVSLLTSLGLVSTQTETESEEVDVGRAISWVVPSQSGLKPGDKVLKGTEVQLLISLGPPLREVPSIIGLTVDQAKEILDPLRLKLIPTGEAPSNLAEAGLIGAQSPPPGEKAQRDSSIAFSISTGPDLVALPNIIGNNYTTVEGRLNEAGFVVGDVKGRKQNRLKQAFIVGQEVANGDLVQRGATIDLVFP